MTTWKSLRALLDGGEVVRVATFVGELAEDERAALVAPLKAFEQEKRRAGAVPGRRQGCAFVVAGAGVLASTADLARWIRRYGRELGYGSGVPIVPLLLELLRTRQESWLVRLVRRLAGIPSMTTTQLRLIEELVVADGIEVPLTDHLVLGWVRANSRPAPAVIDSAWDGLLLRIFDVPGTGRFLVHRQGHGLASALVASTSSGCVDRGAVTDRCLAALERGGRAGDLRGYLAVHAELALRPDEIAQRAWRYVRLVARARSRVAAMAQVELFRVADCGLVGAGLLSAATRLAFARTEKKIVGAQLAWLESALWRDRTLIDGGVGALPHVFDHPDTEIATQALALATKYAPTASPAVRNRLADLTAELPRELHSRARRAVAAIS